MDILKSRVLPYLVKKFNKNPESIFHENMSVTFELSTNDTNMDKTKFKALFLDRNNVKFKNSRNKQKKVLHIFPEVPVFH